MFHPRFAHTVAAQLAVSTSHKVSNLFFVIPSPSWSPAIVQPIRLQTLIQNVGIWMGCS